MSLLAAQDSIGWLDAQTRFWLLVAIGVVGLIVVLFKRDDAREERCRKAIQASSDLSGIGLDRAAEIARSYAVGDHSGVVREARALIDDARQRGGADAIAKDVVVKALPGLLKHPEFGPAVRQAIAEAGASAESVPSATTPPRQGLL